MVMCGKINAMDQKPMDPKDSREPSSGKLRKWSSSRDVLTRDFFDNYRQAGENPNHHIHEETQETILIEICKSDCPEPSQLLKIKMLVDFGETPFNHQDKLGNTGLHYACMKHYYGVIRIFLSIITIACMLKNNDGKSPLKILKDEKKLIKQKMEASWSEDQGKLDEITEVIDLFEKRFEAYPTKGSVKK